MRPADERYFETLEARLEAALERAERARAGSRDPSPGVEIPVATDMADRVEKVLGIEGVAERVRELEGELSREEAALALAADFAEGTVGDYDTRAGKIEGAVRTAVALLTEGVVAAPIEGIDRVELLENDDGTEFVNVYYAGPIRSAGGTAQALSVLVADYVRTLLGLAPYRAREAEIERYAEEVALYDEETGLQYAPGDEETRFVAEHLPVMLDGEATGEEEVEGFRDLDRVDTNNPRGGMCLVLAEGIAQKAPKIERYTAELEEVDWPWLDALVEGNVGKEGDAATGAANDDGGGDAAAAASGDRGDDDATTGAASDGDAGESDDADDAAGTGAASDATDGVAAAAAGAGAGAATAASDDATDGAAAGADRADDDPAGPPRPAASETYLRDLIAGRPVFAHASEPGGFRLRYGRARNHGHATAGVHPATMHLVDGFLAPGTQLKTERPGKAAGVVPVDTIEGPTVRLANGEVRRIDDPEEALAVRNGVEAILDLGEYLVNYGEFVENNQPLAPAGYTYEWWVQEFAGTAADVAALRDDPHVDLEHPDEREAIEWAREYDAPLHPAYTYLWHDVSVEGFEALAGAVADGVVEEGTLVLERTEPVRAALEALLVEHRQADAELRVPEWRALALSLGLTEGRERAWESLSTDAREWAGGDNAVAAVNEVAPFAVRERAPTRVGSRMGRPEKSEQRELSPAVHALFPLGPAGGDQRDVAKAADHAEGVNDAPGRIEVELGRRACTDCGEGTWRTQCPECGGHTEPRYRCPSCGRDLRPDEAGRVHCDRCDVEGTSVEATTVDVREEYREALRRVGERETAFDVLKGVKGLTSAHKTPEPLEKGVLRAKHGVSAFKDGTVRYDMTDLPVTAVRPAEVGATAERFRALGYETDVHGDPLRHDDQLVPLKVQDVVPSRDAGDHLLRTANFVDDLLVNYYDEEPFYEVEDRRDLVGELVFGLAPHTSAAVVGRIVGFTSAAVGYAHPYFHAAKRRNCFHPDTELRFREGGSRSITQKRQREESGEGLPEEERPRTASIGSFVEDRLDDPRTDGFGAQVQELEDGPWVLSYTGLCVPKRVTAVSKHPAPDHLVEIHTESGRSLRVTNDHTMLAFDENASERLHQDYWKAERVTAQELSAGDRVPIPSPIGDGSVDDFLFSPAREINDYPPAVTGWETVESVDIVEADVDHVYCLEVEDTHTVAANGILTGQCDGDEDCVMLLLDGLLNFSEEYLPDRRGGRMDAPLVMTSRIDPTEIDDEAHNVDVVERYPLAFYEATRGMADPDAVDVETAEDTLGTDRAYAAFGHTHDTTDVAAGPDLSAYKTLGSMMDKMEAQLELARKLRAVDERDVAERVIEYHFLPDLLGNLRAFARQEVRCLDCGEKYRRAPLSGDCRECGGDVSLTVHRGSVEKYMDVALRIAEEYGASEYTRQRLEILDRSLTSIFENDKNRRSTLGEFM